MALGGIADVLHALGQQHFQDRAAVIGRAADQEIVGGVAPILLQPFDVGFEPAGGGDQRRGAHLGLAADRRLSAADKNMPSSMRKESMTAAIIDDVDAELFGGQISAFSIARPPPRKNELVRPRLSVPPSEGCLAHAPVRLPSPGYPWNSPGS